MAREILLIDNDRLQYQVSQAHFNVFQARRLRP
jgi:hypothetical protein